MHIDWFTVVAQVINLFVLTWLLKRFLYKPILNAIAAREKHIASGLANAKDKEAKAQQVQAELKQKNVLFEKEKVKLMDQARLEAESLRTKLIKETQAQAEALRCKNKDALQKELDDLSADILKQTKHQVLATASKVLCDLADTSLQARMIDVFLTRLHALSDKDKAALSSDSTTITSAFALLPAQKKALQAEIKTESLIFKITPQLVSGIELSANGQKLVWSISDYLRTLEQESSRAA